MEKQLSSQKILLFLSMYNPTNKRTAKEQSYRCPDGSIEKGKQTNEAPVRYLLKKYKRVSQILCITTTQARNSALEMFQETVRQAAPEVEVVPINYEMKQDFSTEVLPQIIDKIREGDQLLLDTTGGFRNAMMYLLLVSRVLSYIGVRTAAAVYSNFPPENDPQKPGEIEDVLHLVDMFDLVNGMQEMARFGSVDTLKVYYRQPNVEPAVSDLLDAMEKLTADISLCRTNLQEDIDGFNQAMKKVQNTSDPLLRVLLPAFSKKFGEELDIPGVVKWCVENGMIQQALTIYNELIPIYLLREPGGMLAANAQSGKKASETNSYIVEETELFRAGLQKMSEWEDENHKKHYSYTNALKYFHKRLDRAFTLGADYTDRGGEVKQVVADYLYLRTLRNMINHANEKSARKDGLMNYLSKKYHYIDVDSARLPDVRKALEDALEHLNPHKQQP